MTEEMRFDPPTLPPLKKVSGIFAMKRFFQGVGPPNSAVFGMVVNYVKLVDQVAAAYPLVERALKDFAASHGTLQWGLIMTACTQFEICIDGIHRALDFRDAISEWDVTPDDLKELLVIESEIVPKSVVEKMRRLRNAIHHTEDKIMRGKIAEGEAYTMYPTKEGVELGSEKVTYLEIIDSIIRLHATAVRLLDYRE